MFHVKHINSNYADCLNSFKSFHVKRCYFINVPIHNVTQINRRITTTINHQLMSVIWRFEEKYFHTNCVRKIYYRSYYVCR